nr:carbonic anhydrase [uncultured Methanoregula sp.]
MCDCLDSSAAPAPSRRRLLGGAAALAALASSTRVLAADTPLPDNRIGPAAALDRLVQGNARYVAGRSTQRDFSVGRVARTTGQRPFAAILSCADSRIAPELAFDQGPGDLFVVRLAGNFVNDDALASMEYAIQFLEVPLILVLGHSNCGAVSAAIKVVQEGTPLPGHLPGLVNAIRPAVEAASRRQPPNLLVAATEQNVLLNVARLSTAEPILAGRTASGAVRAVGGVYDLASGKVSLV